MEEREEDDASATDSKQGETGEKEVDINNSTMPGPSGTASKTLFSTPRAKSKSTAELFVNGIRCVFKCININLKNVP